LRAIHGIANGADHVAAIESSIRAYLGDRFAMPASATTAIEIIEILRTQTVDSARLAQVESWVTACDAARFSRESESFPPSLRDQSVDLITSLEMITL